MDEMCSCIEKLLHSVTPMIFKEFTRWMPGMVGTLVVSRERGFLNMISWDLDLFNDNLFSLAHCCMCSSLRSLVWALDAGMTKLESSANLYISFPAVIGRRSNAVTMYANGPRPEPWMKLAIIALKADSTSLNFVQCVSGQEIDHPVIYIWRQVEVAQFLANFRMFDSIDHLAEVERNNDDVFVRE